MELARWILVKKSETAWWLLPDTDEGPAQAPEGSWRGSGVRIQSPLLTRPLRIAFDSSVVTEPLMAREVELSLDVRQLDHAPGPAALRPDAPDEEWQHALDEIFEAMRDVARAGGFEIVALGVINHRIELRQHLMADCALAEGSERLLLVCHGWRLLGLSRGLSLKSRLTGAAGLNDLLEHAE